VDVLKVFVEEPAALRGAAAGTAPASLDALLAAPASGYGRAYLAGTHLSDARPRVGLTALADARVFVEPLVAWAGDRVWTARGLDGRLAPVGDVPMILAHPDGIGAVVVGDATPDDDALAAVAAGDRADGLRTLLDAGLAVLVPEPAHDGWDWSVFGPSPLGVADAVRAHAGAPGVARFVAPFQRARGEHSFYFEQWALDPPPAWAERL
jgi:hypothetical protein